MKREQLHPAWAEFIESELKRMEECENDEKGVNHNVERRE